jgi:hypothetical protein
MIAGSPSPSLGPNAPRCCAWALRQGPEGLLLQPVVEADNAKLLPWQERYAAALRQGYANSQFVDDRGGGSTPDASGDWLR